MLDPELVKKIRQIQIYTSHAVNADFAGQYESVFKGRGMEFEEVREYIPGDDIRTIDWNVTARAGKPYIKRFVEEREMTVMLVVDMSASGSFATRDKLKNELAAEICAVLAFAAIRNNDKVGLILFTDEIELFIPPKKGSGHVLRLIREVLGFKVTGKGTDIPMALDYLARVTKKQATVFLISDFIAQGFEKTLSLVNRRHDVIAIAVSDPAEQQMPSVGIVDYYDPETGDTKTIDTSSRSFKKKYIEKADQRNRQLMENFRSIKVDCIPVSTDKEYITDIVRFFHVRHRRL